MLKHRKSNKLLLNQETLRALQALELTRVAGGVMKNTKSNACTGPGTGASNGNGSEDTVQTCLDSYLACYF